MLCRALAHSFVVRGPALGIRAIFSVGLLVNAAGISTVTTEIRGNGVLVGRHRLPLMRRQSARAINQGRPAAPGIGEDIGAAPLRVPARRRVRRLPIMATSAGPFPTPPLRSTKQPPWGTGMPSSTRRTPNRSPAYHEARRAFLTGNVGLSEATRSVVASSKKRRGRRCDPLESTCCKPDDPPEVYEACKEKQEDDAGAAAASKYFPCPADTCEKNCCCFLATTARIMLKLGSQASTAAVSVALKAAVTLQSLTNSVLDIVPSPAQQEPEDPDEAREYARDLCKDIMTWWFCAMLGSYLFVRLDEMRQALRDRSKRTEYKKASEQNRSQDDQEKALEDPASAVEAMKYISAHEAERLGGVVRSLIVQMKTINRNMWHFVIFFSLGLFHWVMRTPNQVCIMVLGKSGRLLILNREPLTPMTYAFKLFAGLGVSFMAIFTVFFVWLRAMERTIIEAQKSPDPQVRKAAKEGDTVAHHLVGKVHVAALMIWFIMWFVYLAVLYVSLRPWAGNDNRDYYESVQANSAQYFRGGTRGMIPWISKRRRSGGMKLFFGPYPSVNIWKAMGKGFGGAFLDCLEPHAILPKDTDRGIPSSGSGGVPRSFDSELAFSQKVLGAANWFLGTLGLTFAAIHMMNLGQNYELCPNTEAINLCVRHGDCTRYAQSGWFQMYMERSGFMTADSIAEACMDKNIKLMTIGAWLKLPNLAEAQEAAIMIAQKACMDRRDELIDGPIQDTSPKQADTLGQVNAGNYIALREGMGVDIVWDNVQLECKKCTTATTLHYFSNVENFAEVFEVFLLCITCYISAMLIKAGSRELANSPIGDMNFESDPSSGADMDVDKIEKAALDMMSTVFFYRYNSGVPTQVKRIEEKIRFALSRGMDPTKFADPWKYDESAQSWEEYGLTCELNARMFLVNRRLLGILNGEECVSAWSESPRLTTWQTLILSTGILFFLILPLGFGLFIGAPRCCAEGLVSGGTFLLMFYVGVIKRRINAGFVLTTRRLFQLSRTPPYYDLYGKVEPLLKIDVVVHNATITYLSGQFEAQVPIMRQILAKLCGWPIYRPGLLQAWGGQGILQLWRDLGDTREIIEAFSKVSYAEPVKGLSPQFGLSMMAKEAENSWENAPGDPCWPLILCCCPYTANPPYADPDIIKRYCFKFDKEEDVYGRLLTTRPNSVTDLVCGKGLRCACECCPCCMFDEALTDVMITTHRVLVEQRCNQRYCRCCICLRPIPNLRVTFLSNFRVSSFVIEKIGQAWGLFHLQQNMILKVLPDDAREFPSGLMMRQQPYRFVTSDKEGAEKTWVTHLCKIMDMVSADPGSKELQQSSSEDEDSEDYDYDYGGGGGPGKGRGKGAVGKGAIIAKRLRDKDRAEKAAARKAAKAERDKAAAQAADEAAAKAKGKARPKGKARRKRRREGDAVAGDDEGSVDESEESEGEVVYRGGLLGALREVATDMAVGVQALAGNVPPAQSSDQPSTQS